MKPHVFAKVIAGLIKRVDVDLSETFLRCIPSDATVEGVKTVILEALDEEYSSISADLDLWESLNLDERKWLERFHQEFLKVLLLNGFQPEQILRPLNILSRQPSRGAMCRVR